MTDDWPAFPDPAHRAEYERILYEGQVQAAVNARQTAAEERAKALESDRQLELAAWTAEYALEKSVHDARLEVVKAGIDRARAGAEFVRNAAAGIATVYTGLLGVTFAVKEGKPLPAAGVAPAIFLAMALVLATAYVAFLTRSPSIPAPQPHSSLRTYQERRVDTFTSWIASYALHRAYALHASIFSLSFATLFLPAAFVGWKGLALWIPVGVAVAVVVSLPLATRPGFRSEPPPSGGAETGKGPTQRRKRPWSVRRKDPDAVTSGGN